MASPESAPPRSASNDRVTIGSSTTGNRPDGIGFAPSSRTARSAASRAASCASISPKLRPAENPLPVWVSVPSPAIANAEHDAVVRRVDASTPSEFATAASTAASP